MTSDLLDLSLLDVRRGLTHKHFSCTEYVEALLHARNAQRALNCFITSNDEALRIAARAYDRRPGAGPLAGIPVALKDNIDVAGLPTTAGTHAMRAHVPGAHAHVAQRLFEAGALFAGKTSMHELALGITTNNGVFGPCRNPWNPARIPGGSSGGSGAAVAARLVPAALGTDTGGSVRLPAALCGVAGLRPTVGRYPQAGIAPISHTRDTAGPIARTIDDLALLDAVLADIANEGPPPELHPRSLRLGVLREQGFARLDPAVREVIEGSLDTLARAGIELVDVYIEGLDTLNDAIGFPVVLYEFVRDLPAYLAAGGSTLTLRDIAAGIGSPDVADIARLAMDDPVSDAVYRGALDARITLQAAYRRAFMDHGIDALVFPTAPLPACPIANDAVLVDGVSVPVFAAYIQNTDPGSNAGIPGVTLPAGLTRDGLPVGLELDGPADCDRHLLAVARAVERVLGPIPRP
ncbi:indoleacetamide hydrolase [Paraburkholderia sp. ZP32-5]|uniref:indoleacetamide hydrolase n=1 Tax=Paraburkholderia sp. ZP32-5 TaxID=2883245 RepID=UPI001F1F127A|nr:indoleacetamide hydrolase [Paraburkholderia sp. ZP32-5]